jgi:N-acetylglucosamine malate deacetylase 1
MTMNFKKVLILSPHTDDGELGAGGTIARFAEEGKEIYYVAFSGCEISIPRGLAKDVLCLECAASTAVFGLPPENVTLLSFPVRTFPEHRQEILDELLKIRDRIAPDLVLVPSSHDMHQDHTTIYWEALRAFKKSASIWGYEHPWNNLNFNTDVFVRLNKPHLEKKMEALRKYASQSNRVYMDEKNVTALLSTHGAQLDSEYAEAFELIRLIY